MTDRFKRPGVLLFAQRGAWLAKAMWEEYVSRHSRVQFEHFKPINASLATRENIKVAFAGIASLACRAVHL